MDSFENNLKHLRTARNMKQEELAEQMHVSRQTVSGWETGRRQPDLNTVKRLAEVLDADIQELVYGDNPEKYPRFQKKHITQAAVLGVTILVLFLFQILVLPHFSRLCATNHWGLALFICHEVFPAAGAFSLGALIPCALRLFEPIRIGKRRTGWLIACGFIAWLPGILFLVGAFPLPSLILYTAGRALIVYIFPFFSGICIGLATGLKESPV